MDLNTRERLTAADAKMNPENRGCPDRADEANEGYADGTSGTQFAGGTCFGRDEAPESDDRHD